MVTLALAQMVYFFFVQAPFAGSEDTNRIGDPLRVQVLLPGPVEPREPGPRTDSVQG